MLFRCQQIGTTEIKRCINNWFENQVFLVLFRCPKTSTKEVCNRLFLTLFRCTKMNPKDGYRCIRNGCENSWFLMLFRCPDLVPLQEEALVGSCGARNYTGHVRTRAPTYLRALVLVVQRSSLELLWPEPNVLSSLDSWP